MDFVWSDYVRDCIELDYTPNYVSAPLFNYVKQQEEKSFISEFGDLIRSDHGFRRFLSELLRKLEAFSAENLIIADESVKVDDALLSIRYLFRNSCGINIADDDTLLSIRYLFPDSDGINGGKRQRSRKHHRHGRRKRNWEK